jgi:hypothetical protein
MNSVWSIRLVRALFFFLFVFTGMIIAVGFELHGGLGALIGALAMGLLWLLDMILVMQPLVWRLDCFALGWSHALAFFS